LLSGDQTTAFDAQQTSSALLNVEMTLTRLAGDEALLAEVAQIFLRTVPQILASLNAALASNDLEHAYAEAHSLKGAVAPFEAPEVFNAVVSVEKQEYCGARRGVCNGREAGRRFARRALANADAPDETRAPRLIRSPSRYSQSAAS
jgi:HPt (histidine-containing phosphotransfer) domain-containing protein